MQSEEDCFPHLTVFPGVQAPGLSCLNDQVESSLQKDVSDAGEYSILAGLCRAHKQFPSGRFGCLCGQRPALQKKIGHLSSSQIRTKAEDNFYFERRNFRVSGERHHRLCGPGGFVIRLHRSPILAGILSPHACCLLPITCRLKQ